MNTHVLSGGVRLQVLMEFNEYATEIDDEFVRKSVRCIGRCAIKLDNAAERYAMAPRA